MAGGGSLKFAAQGATQPQQVSSAHLFGSDAALRSVDPLPHGLTALGPLVLCSSFWISLEVTSTRKPPTPAPNPDQLCAASASVPASAICETRCAEVHPLGERVSVEEVPAVHL